MSSIGLITKGLAEKFSGLIAEIEKSNAYNKSLITCSLSHINDTMNDIGSLTSSQTNRDQGGKFKGRKFARQTDISRRVISGYVYH
jgi:hypothetical protein